MAPFRLNPRDAIGERPVLRPEQAAREHDGELISDGKTLPISSFNIAIARRVFRQGGLLRTHG
jgi:hypothetical protein